MTPIDDGNEYDAAPSKSQLKRDMLALQKLGETLATLKPHELKRVPLSDSLLSAIRELAAMKSHGAMRRQRQLIGKLMRDEDQLAIQDAVDTLHLPPAKPQKSAPNYPVEVLEWAKRLVDNDHSIFSELQSRWGTLDHQKLRQLTRNVVKNQPIIESDDKQADSPQSENPPSKAHRQLLDWLRDQDQQHSRPNLENDA